MCPADVSKAQCTACARKAVYSSIAEAIVLIALKITLGMFSGSRALIAASLYSLQDLVSAVVAALGLRISEKPPDRNHPYGHDKVEYLVVLLTSLMILLSIVALAMTALASLLGETSAAESPTMLALWFAAACGVLCWIDCGYQECSGKRLNSPSLTSSAAHMHADLLSSVAVVVSVIGGKLGYPILDHIVAIAEAVHVVYISGRMLGSAISGLIDSAAEPRLIDKLVNTAGQFDSVMRIRRATARWSGQTLFAQIDVDVPGQMTVPEADELRAHIQDAVKAQVAGQSRTLVRVSPASA